MSQTRGSTPRLSEAARHLVMPSGIVSTGWPSTKAEAQRLGIEFDPWQDGAGQVILAKRADGSYAATIGGVVISIPRQVGKTFLIGAIVFALSMLHPGLLVIWTAHQLKTAGETFRAMQAMARMAKVRPFVKRVVLGSGDEAIEFTNGSRILFGARERGFGLGFTKVGVLVIDEAQRVTEKTMDDLVPTTNQADNPLIFLVGTPPRPTDAGEVFRTRRKEALSGESDDMVYLEFSADADVDPSKWSKNHVDWAAVAKANPSFPLRTNKTAVLRMLKNLGHDSFGREGLGIWDDDRDNASSAISREWWDATGVEVPPRDGVKSFAVAFSADGQRLALAGAVKHDEGVHVELVDAFAGSMEMSLGPLADWLAARWRDTAAIVLSGRAGAGLLADMLRERRVPDRVVKVATTPQYFQSCQMLLDSVKESVSAAENGEELTLTHLAIEGQGRLDASVMVCDKVARGKDGAWAWSPTTPDGDETPIEAVSLALYGARTSKRVPRGDRDREAVIL